MTTPPTPAPAPTPLLELRNVERGLRPVPGALRRVARRSRAGKVLALLGSNGAGKTTIARVCSGLVRADERRGAASTGVRHHEAAAVPARPARHLARARGPVGVRVADGRGEPRAVVPARARPRGVGAGSTRAYELFPRLGERRQADRRDALGRRAAHARRWRGCMVHPPRLLIADELSLGLAPIIVDEVYRTSRRSATPATTLLIVEQLREARARDRRRGHRAHQGDVAYSGPASDELGDLIGVAPAHAPARRPSPNGQTDS